MTQESKIASSMIPSKIDTLALFCPCMMDFQYVSVSLFTHLRYKNAFHNSPVAKYAHCIVVKSIKVDVPSFTLAVLSIDSKYNHNVITKRWNYIESELLKKGITVINNGSDGAGPFLKAMLEEARLFSLSRHQNVPVSWTFYLMPEIKERGQCSQDVKHLLAKLCTRLLGISNLIVLGFENACRSHIQYLYDNIPKERHGLTQQCIDNKDKQNYPSIATLVGDDLKDCRNEVSNSVRTTGTIGNYH